MKAFLDLFAERSQALCSRLPEDHPLVRELQAAEPALTLARAVLDKAGLPEHPLQIAVLGPTQAGKSTLVNLLLNAEVAGVSPLAGFTVHPQGFLHGLAEDTLPWLDDYFAGYRRCRITELPRQDYRHFALKPLQHTRPQLLESVVWDTPDFDSLRARHYLPGVLRTAALADVLVVVVSKDKYADRTVWDMLTLLEPLGQPTLVCLNKVTPTGHKTLLCSWQEKWRSYRRDPVPTVVPLLYWQGEAERAEAGEALVTALEPLLKQARSYRKRLDRQALTLARRHWPQWRAPLHAELEAEQAWQRLVTEALEQALTIYRHDFLDHPVAYETFQRALAELLILLEIPGLARPMMAVRRVVTWPLRQLFNKRRDGLDSPGELVVLSRAVEHALLQLQQALMEQCHHSPRHWWENLAQQYRKTRPALLEDFHRAAARYYEDFQPQVERAAQELYQRLREMPVTLNSLRAARASADAAGLALLLQTGGIGPHDFVLAPAVLSLTSWLSESALGKYMERVAADLKRRQLDRVRQLVHDHLAALLVTLPNHLDPHLRFGIDIATLDAVEAQLKERRYGLHLF